MLSVIQFLHPVFLYGLLLLAIPVLLHLFSLKRYKKVYFSNFNFLEALQKQKKNSSRLKNLVLLFLRLLALSCIVIAFATPYLNPEGKALPATTTPRIFIYADNSFSMTNTGSQGSLFEEAKKHLFDIVDTYPAGSRFSLFTNDKVLPVTLDKEKMLQAIGNLKISPATKPLSQVYKEVKESGENQPGTLFLISDFQKKNCDFQHIITDSTLESVFLMMKPENRSNLYIKEVNFGQAFHKQNQSETVYITLVNTSDRDFHHIPLTLTINGKKRSIIQTDLEAHSEKKVEISYLNTAEDFYKGTVEISDFPVPFDNTFYFAYPVSENTEILYVWQQEENPYFGKLFSDSSHFSFTSIPVNQTIRQNLPRYSLIILDGLTDSSTGLESMWEDYLMNGGNLLVLPASSSPEVQNKFLQKIQAPRYDKRDTNTVIAHIETQAALFRDAFEQPDIKTILPQIRQNYRLILPAHTEILLSDKHSAPLLVSRHYGKGNLYLSAFNFLPTDSDLVFHPLFVPLLVNMAFQVNTGLHTSYFLNTTAPVLLNTRTIQTNQPLQIRNENHTFEFIPEVRKNFSGDLQLTNATTIQEAGLFEVYQEDRLVDVLAWNYDRTESQMEFCKEQELSQYFPRSKVPDIKTTCFDHNSELVKEIVLQDNNKYLTGWFILIAVSALLLEQLVWRKKLN